MRTSPAARHYEQLTQLRGWAQPILSKAARREPLDSYDIGCAKHVLSSLEGLNADYELQCRLRTAAFGSPTNGGHLLKRSFL